MRWLGIDPAAGKGVALAWIDETEGIGHAILDTSGEVGARRLRDIRISVIGAIRAMPPMLVPACVVVEIPWSRRPNFALIGSAAVAMEAAQYAAKGAVVMEVATQVWKQEVGLAGNASVADYLKHSRLLGYRGNNDDIAAALCMAQVARTRWERAVAAPPALSA